MSNKRESLKNLTPIIEKILREKPNSRNDDYMLYGFYLNKNGYSIKISFSDLIMLIKNKEVASIETVGRVRRKLQETYQELCGDETVRKKTSRLPRAVQRIRACNFVNQKEKGIYGFIWSL